LIRDELAEIPDPPSKPEDVRTEFQVALSSTGRPGSPNVAEAIVVVTTKAGLPVQGATVHGSWTGGMGGVSFANTDATGTARFTSASFNQPATMALTVTDVEAHGFGKLTGASMTTSVTVGSANPFGSVGSSSSNFFSGLTGDKLADAMAWNLTNVGSVSVPEQTRLGELFYSAEVSRAVNKGVGLRPFAEMVFELQKELGVDPDGKFGPRTRARLLTAQFVEPRLMPAGVARDATYVDVPTPSAFLKLEEYNWAKRTWYVPNRPVAAIVPGSSDKAIVVAAKNDTYYFEEGNKPKQKAYKDSAGLWTIGYGFLLQDDKGNRAEAQHILDTAGISGRVGDFITGGRVMTLDEADRAFEAEALEKIPTIRHDVNGFDALPFEVKVRLADMAFHRGSHWFDTSHSGLAAGQAIARHDYAGAARALIASNYSKTWDGCSDGKEFAGHCSYGQRYIHAVAALEGFSKGWLAQKSGEKWSHDFDSAGSRWTVAVVTGKTNTDFPITMDAGRAMRAKPGPTGCPSCTSW
jgi:GH24 family phage-related lysozyme (muramidase)